VNAERGVPAMLFLLLCRPQIPWATRRPGFLLCSRVRLGPGGHPGLAPANSRSGGVLLSALLAAKHDDP